MSSSISSEEAGRRAEVLAREWVSSDKRTSTLMDTQLAHAGVLHGNENAALSPPLEMATTYSRPAEGPYRSGDSIYTRCDNPTRVLLEREIAKLEYPSGQNKMVHGDGQQQENSADSSATSFAFASGMMAASSIILAHQAPLQVILPNDLYHGVPTVMIDVFQRFNVHTKRVDMTDPKNLDSLLLSDTFDSTIVWIETPSNPLCHVIDIAATCQHIQQLQQGSAQNVTLVVDSTLAPPTLTQPLLLGADVVMHSGTKYLGGHSDVLLGVVTVSPRNPALVQRLKQVQTNVGGVASPMDCWLTLRGLRTLSLRVARQSSTALRLAEHVVASSSQTTTSKQQRDTVLVHYPGLESHPQHAIAKRQMKNGCYGGVLSIEFATAALAMAFAGALRTIVRATSLGGTETLIEHRASIEPPGRVTSPEGLLRISVGLEDPADLLADIDRAMEIAHQVVSE